MQSVKKGNLVSNLMILRGDRVKFQRGGVKSAIIDELGMPCATRPELIL